MIMQNTFVKTKQDYKNDCKKHISKFQKNVFAELPSPLSNSMSPWEAFTLAFANRKIARNAISILLEIIFVILKVVDKE